MFYEDLFGELSTIVYGTNMTVEGLLNRIKTASPRSSRPPTAERVVHAGVLAEHMRRYLLHGFSDNRRLAKKGLVKMGVSLNPDRKTICKTNVLQRVGNHATRQHLAKLNHERVAVLRANPGMDSKEAVRIAMENTKAADDPIPPPRGTKTRQLKHPTQEPLKKTSLWRQISGERWPLSQACLSEQCQTGGMGGLKNNQLEGHACSRSPGLVCYRQTVRPRYSIILSQFDVLSNASRSLRSSRCSYLYEILGYGTVDRDVFLFAAVLTQAVNCIRF